METTSVDVQLYYRNAVQSWRAAKVAELAAQDALEVCMGNYADATRDLASAENLLLSTTAGAPINRKFSPHFPDLAAPVEAAPGEQGDAQLCCRPSPFPTIGACTEPAGHVARYATWHAHLDRSKAMETRWAYTASERPD